MKNPFRISGLLLFTLIIGLFSSFYLIFADRILTNAIIESGTEIIGAKVELSEGVIDLDNFSVSLNSLKVTNPKQPMSNIVEAGKLTFNLDAEALAWNKTIIDEIIVEDLYLNTKRAKSGAIDGRKLSLTNVDLFNDLASIENLSEISLPDPKKLIDSTELETIKAIEELEKDIKLSRDKIETQYNALPTKQQLDEYKNQFKEIKNKQKSGNKLLGLLSKGSELKKLKKAVSNDLKSIKSFTNQVNKTQSLLSNKLKHIQSLPDQDIERLTKQYDLTGDGVGNIAQQLFGNEIGAIISEGMTWYKRLSPILEQLSSVKGNEQLSATDSNRNSGRDVLFPDHQLLPDDLIKLIKINTGDKTTDGIKLSGVMKNLTSQPQRWSEPLEIALRGSADYFELLNIKAILDHRTTQRFNDQFEISANNISLKAITALAANDKLSATEGLLNFNSTGKVTDKELNLDISLIFSHAAFVLTDSVDNSQWLEKVINGLSKLKSFKVNVAVTGSVEKPTLKISAPDLKSLASKMASQAVSGKVAEFKNQLKEQIADKTGTKLDGLKGQLGALSSYQEQLDTKQSNYQNLLKGLL